MAFCSNCGKEISDSAAFCGNCGNQIKNDAPKIKKSDIFENFDFKKVLNALKKYFLNFYVDYNSKIFKFAMIIFLAIGIGEPTYYLVSDILPFNIYELFSGASTVFEFLICALLFGVFSIFILKLKYIKTVKKSNFLIVIWIVTLVLNTLVFFVDDGLWGMMKYILYSDISVPIIELLGVVSTAVLIFKNKPKYPIVLIISALSFALTNSSVWSIRFAINIYKLLETTDNLIDILYSLRYIILVIALFLLVYIVPRKISKWLVLIPVLLVVVLEFIRLIDGFSFVDVLNFIIDISIIVAFVLFALSCSKKIDYDYIIENKEKTQRSALKIGIISIGSAAVIVFIYLLVSAIVCSVQINNGIERWKSQIIDGSLKNSAQWSSMNSDIFKYKCDKFASQFIDEYSLYETLKENRNSMEKILVCYSAYKSGNVDEDIIEQYSYISIDESWEDDSILSTYYTKYLEMQPDIENVSVSAYVDVDGGKIEITVKNKNQMPLSKCTVKCDFTILFIEGGSYSSTEYGRGSKTIEVENIDGGSSKTEIISFEPDEYYDGYGSYLMATLMDKRVEIISIE